jgi:hypothetical protein
LRRVRSQEELQTLVKGRHGASTPRSPAADAMRSKSQRDIEPKG